MRDSITVTGSSPEIQTDIDKTCGSTRKGSSVPHAPGLPASQIPWKYRGNFERYLERAYDNLFTANSPTGQLPLELADAIWSLRYPNVKRWDKSDSMNMAAWTTDDSVPPNVHLLLSRTVPAALNTFS